MQQNFFFRSALMGFSVLVFIGCSNPDARYVKVAGTITYNGQAVEGATITFLPVDPAGESASGLTDTGGMFSLTSTGAVEGGRGALPGEYRVRITKVPVLVDKDFEAYDRGEIDYDELLKRRASQPATPVKGLLPEKYAHPDKTVLTATVEKGKNNGYDFDLTD